jgi:hypothetical protein
MRKWNNRRRRFAAIDNPFVAWRLTAIDPACRGFDWSLTLS